MTGGRRFWSRRDVELAYRFGLISFEMYRRLVSEIEDDMRKEQEKVGALYTKVARILLEGAKK